MSRGWAKASASTYAYLVLSPARWYPSSSRVVRLSNVFLVFHWVFSFRYGFQVVIRSVHRLSRILLTCPAQVNFRLRTCAITSVTFVFSLTQKFVFLSRYVMFNIPLSNCVCAAASLFFAWVVSAHVSVFVMINEKCDGFTCHDSSSYHVIIKVCEKLTVWKVNNLNNRNVSFFWIRKWLAIQIYWISSAMRWCLFRFLTVADVVKEQYTDNMRWIKEAGRHQMVRCLIVATTWNIFLCTRQCFSCRKTKIT